MRAKYIKKGSTLLKAFDEKKQLNVLLVDYGTPRIGIVALAEKDDTDSWRGCDYKAVLVYGQTDYNATKELLFGCYQGNSLDRTDVKVKMRGFLYPLIKTDRYFNCIDFYNLPNNHVDLRVIDDDYWSRLSEFETTHKKRYNRAVEEDLLEVHKVAFLLSDGSPQIYDWCFKNLKLNVDSFSNLWWILKTRLKYKTKQGTLKRGSITSYIGDEELDELIMEFVDMKTSADIARTISEFNTQQKKVLKQTKITKREKKLLMALHRLPFERRRNLIRKVSTIDDADKIFEIISITVGASFGWNEKSLMSHIAGMREKLNLDIVYDKDNVVILRINDFKTISYIGKATNWCITKDLDYWENYTVPSDNQQYVILNFNLPENDEYSIVGVTLKEGWAIRAAHSFTNKDLLSSPFLYFDLPRNKSICEYLSSIDAMRPLIKRNVLSSLETMEGILDYISKNVTKDFNVEPAGNGKFAVISKSHKMGSFIGTNLSVKQHEPGLPSFPNIKSYQLFILLFNLNEKVDWSKRMCTIMWSSYDELLGMSGTMNNLEKSRIRALLSEWGIDLSQYIPIPTGKLSEFNNAIEDVNADKVISMLSNDKEIYKLVKNSVRLQIYLRGMIESLIAIPAKDSIIKEKLNEGNLPLFVFRKKLYENGIKFGDIIPNSSISSFLYHLTSMVESNNNEDNDAPIANLGKGFALYKKFIREFIDDENIDISKLDDPYVYKELQKIINKN